jgi:hypothetical protein
MADIAPLVNAQDIEDFNKDLRPIALTSTLSKIAADFIIQHDLKPKLLLISSTLNNLVLFRDQVQSLP